MTRIIGDFARRGYQRAKRIPVVRRLLTHPLVTRLAATAAKWVPPADPGYERWINVQRQSRQHLHGEVEPGLFSLITPVWNTPPEFLRTLAASVFGQIGDPPFEWIVLDNGSTSAETREVLHNVIEPNPRVRLFRREENRGIVAGMRDCLQQATGRYVVAVDHDDRLDPDCLAILAEAIRNGGFPPLLYSDEDHLCGHNRLLPYFKPGWDPVLFLNSAYTAHVGVMDRRTALDLDVYGDSATNSCPDWDAFLRSTLAGHQPVHVPEILYSWRMHPGSTSANMHSKSDVTTSHRAMLARYLDSLPHPERFEAVLSPLFSGTPDWWIRRRRIAPRPLLVISLSNNTPHGPSWNGTDLNGYPVRQTVAIPADAHPGILRDLIAAHRDCLVVFADNTLEISGDEWPWEVLGLMERFPDIGVVGGRICDNRGRVIDAGRYFGFDAGCVCPDRGRSSTDAGYFHQMWKQRSVDAVSSRFCLFDAGFFLDVLDNGQPNDISLRSLGLWAGARAARIGRRVVYSPFLTATADADWHEWRSDNERRKFLHEIHDFSSEPRYYSRCLDKNLERAYQQRDHAGLGIDGIIKHQETKAIG